MATAVETGLRTIPLASINFNPNNPRKSHDKGALKELAESIKAHGVIEPVVVRPDPWDEKHKTFELVVGERRVRASKLANQESIIAIVREMTDRQALEIMVIENDQREDPHPLDQARGYKSWLSMPDDAGKVGTCEELAVKTGNSVSWILARLKLLELIPAAQEALDQELITASHAVLVARLQPIDQVRALDACFHAFGNDRELKKLDPAALKLKDLDIEDEGLLPEKGLREWIQDNINLKLKDVPWKLDDANLVSAAGPCTTCLKRSTSNPGLFAELTVKDEDTCFDAACFNGKRQAFVQITIKADKAIAIAAEKQGDEPKEILLQLSDLQGWNKPKPDQATYREGQWLPAKPGSCVNTRMGILVRGENAGQRKSVCIDQSCKVHKHTLRAAPSKTASPTDKTADDLGQANRRAKETVEELLVQDVLSRVAKSIKQPDAKTLRFVADFYVHQTYEDLSTAAAAVGIVFAPDHKDLDVAIEKYIKSANAVELMKLLFALIVSGDLVAWAPEFKEIASFGKVDIGQARKNLTAKIKRSCHFCGCTELTPCNKTTGKNGDGLGMQPYKTVEGACHWIGKGAPATDFYDDVCSNPDCVTEAMKDENRKAKVQTPAKAKKGKR